MLQQYQQKLKHKEILFRHQILMLQILVQPEVTTHSWNCSQNCTKDIMYTGRT